MKFLSGSKSAATGRLCILMTGQNFVYSEMNKNSLESDFLTCSRQAFTFDLQVPARFDWN